MGYVACEKCLSYHELKKGEQASDYFDIRCNCGGRLRYYENVEDIGYPEKGGRIFPATKKSSDNKQKRKDNSSNSGSNFYNGLLWIIIVIASICLVVFYFNPLNVILAIIGFSLLLLFRKENIKNNLYCFVGGFWLFYVGLFIFGGLSGFILVINGFILWGILLQHYFFPNILSRSKKLNKDNRETLAVLWFILMIIILVAGGVWFAVSHIPSISSSSQSTGNEYSGTHVLITATGYRKIDNAKVEGSWKGVIETDNVVKHVEGTGDADFLISGNPSKVSASFTKTEDSQVPLKVQIVKDGRQYAYKYTNSEGVIVSVNHDFIFGLF